MKFEYKKAPALRETTVSEGLATGKLDLKTIARAIPCQEACPAKTNVPLYIEMISRGNDDGAYRVNQEDNVFPGVLGRICTRVCEKECRHVWTNVEGPVQICHLKRYAADHIREVQGPLPGRAGATDKRIAVVGAGPAGLTAARELARLGHRVAVFERGPIPGGMLVEGIPAFRLPRDIVAAEIELIEKNGVEIRTNEDVDAARLAQLKNEFDAVLVAAGTTVPMTLNVAGATEVGQSGLQFMQRFNRGEIPAMSGDIVVIGGGFTAVDCARSAKRLCGDKGTVTIAYRRTESSMAADHSELEAMAAEGIFLRTLLSPVAVEKTTDGRAQAVFTRNAVTGPSSDLKPAVAAIAGSREVLAFDQLIVAIGQKRDDSLIPPGVTINSDGTTGDPLLFVTGDFQGGSADVISAVASGKAAASAVDTALMGFVRTFSAVVIETTDNDGETGRVRDHDIQWPLPMPTRDVRSRMAGGAEVETGFTPDIANVAATRCYLCHYKFEIDQDICIHCDWCIGAAPRNCIHKLTRIVTDEDGFPGRYFTTDRSAEATYIYIDNDECIRCGKCLRVCPVGAISMKKLALTTCTREKKK